MGFKNWMGAAFGKEPESPKLESQIHNELGFQPGQFLTLDVLDHRDKEYRVERVEALTRNIDGVLFNSTDYILGCSSDTIARILRVAEKRSWLFYLYDDFGFDQSFLVILNEALESTFSLDDESAEYLPIGSSALDIDRVDNLGEQETVRQWSFGRETKDEAGQSFNELLFVEMSKGSGWFSLWRGTEIPTDHIMAI